ncbi:MAG TPA: hypothetical protein VIF83_15975 [Gemmatimonadaceae bacterium]|jgi:hypothetical protein
MEPDRSSRALVASIRRHSRGILVSVAIGCGVIAFALASAPDSTLRAAQTPPLKVAADSVTQVQFRNVDFYVDPQLPLRIHRLRGTMRSKTGGMVFFDDKTSYIITLDAAEVGLGPRDLSLMLNKYVFGYPGAPLKRMQVTISGNEIVQKGILHKVLDVPFEIRAQLSVTPDGLIRIHPTRTELMGMHVDGLMKALGLALDEIINIRKARGATLKGNDIYLDPAKILPPPAFEGKLSGVRLSNNEVIQTFGTPSTEPPALVVPDSAAQNYMYYRGGVLRFGKLVLLEADMLLTELDQSDTFRFNLDRYQGQLREGYVRSLPSMGLEVFMRDIDKLGKSRIEVRSVPAR